jgi:two-component system KDP operon response regulator KdpE
VESRCASNARRRSAAARDGGHGGPHIDLSSHTIVRNGQEVRLTKTEWSLVEALARHPGKLLTHSWLLDRVWGDVLRVFISQLRHKIEEDPRRPQIIVTDPGIGYHWLLRPSEPPD